MRTLFIAAALSAVCLGIEAVSQHRSFRGGYPVGSGGASRVNRQGALSENMVPGAGQATGRKKNIRLVKAEGSFAMKCAKADPIQVELQEPKGTRWVTPPTSGKYSCLIERGAAAKKRTANVSGGDGTAVATVRRLADGNVELTLKRVKIGAPADAEPEETMTIGLMAP